jgi:histidine triad (HIT) family protein
METDCPFCQIVRREQPARVVYEDEHVLAFFPRRPATLGHTLVIPKQHFADIWTIGHEAAQHVLQASLQICQGLRAALQPEGLNMINSAGAAATQTVFHFHMHLVPRWQDDRIDDFWARGDVFADHVKDDAADRVAAACAELVPWTASAMTSARPTPSSIP